MMSADLKLNHEDMNKNVNDQNLSFEKFRDRISWIVEKNVESNRNPIEIEISSDSDSSIAEYSSHSSDCIELSTANETQQNSSLFVGKMRLKRNKFHSDGDSEKNRLDLSIMSVQEIHDEMKDEGWEVDLKDELFSSTRKQYQARYYWRKSGSECKRCREFGHFIANCPKNTVKKIQIKILVTSKLIFNS